MKNIIIVSLVLVLIGGAIWFLLTRTSEEPILPEEEITSFEECVVAGYSILESYPRQCKTPDGKTFTEEIQLEDETAGWQTYRNEEYGFEVEYPSLFDSPGRESFTVLPRKWEDLWLQDPLVEAVSFEGPRVEEWGERLPVELLVWKVRESEPCDSRQYSQLKKYTYGEIKKEEEFMSETSDANVWQISGIIPRGSDYIIDTYFSRKDCDLLTEDKHVIVIRQIGSSLDSFPFYSQMLSTFRFLE